MASYIYPRLPKVDYVCDKKADGELKLYDATIIKPELLEEINEELFIIICVVDIETGKEIIEYLNKLNIDGYAYSAFTAQFPNPEYHYCYGKEKRALKRVQIVTTDPTWIFRKFADRMADELANKGYDVHIDTYPDKSADINHYINFALCYPLFDLRDTLMIDHIDSLKKVSALKERLSLARMGICMSNEMMLQLTQMGIPREKLCYINPAHDGKMKHKKLVLGITHKVHPDTRKRENAIIDICNSISSDFFQIKIMGTGWEEIVGIIRAKGFEVEYYNEFDYDKYHELMPTFDYYLFWGYDEGSMGYLDAIAAGVDTIVTPQGFHLDIVQGITHPVRTVGEIVKVLNEIENKKRSRIKIVEEYTWAAYVNKHLEVWNYILGNGYDRTNKHKYIDGIHSVLKVDV
jgi:hypothetical protein